MVRHPAPRQYFRNFLLSSTFFFLIAIPSCNLERLSGLPFVSRFFESPAKDITLTYWGLWEDEQAVMQPLIDDFVKKYETENPKNTLTIKYEKRLEPKLDRYKDTIATRLSQGTGPDIARVHLTWVKDLADELAPAPEKILNPAEFSNTFYPAANTWLVSEGSVFGVPLEYDGMVLFYNRDMVSQQDLDSVTTWEGFRQKAVEKTLWEENNPKKKILRAGAAIGSGANISHSSDILSLLIAQAGLDPLTDLGSAGASDALTFYTNFVKEDHVWDAGMPYSVNAFANGQAAFMFGPSWRAFDISNLNPSLKFGVTLLPQLPTIEGNEVYWGSFWAEVVSDDSENQDVAWQFLKFLTEQEQQRKFFDLGSRIRMFGEPYARKDLAQDLSSHDILGPLLSGAEKAVVSKTADFSGNDAYVDALKQAIEAVLKGTSSSQALQTAQKTINQLEGR